MSTGRERFELYRFHIRGLRFLISYLPVPIVLLILVPFRSLPGSIGALARYLIWSRRLGSLGDAVAFAYNIILKSPHNISIGDRCSIHDFCYFDGFGRISIGSDVSIAHGCSILSTNHRWEDHSVAIKYNKVIAAPVIVADDVWIGCGVRILAGVTIGPRSVIAAGAVVTRSLTGNALYAGIPARKVRDI